MNGYRRFSICLYIYVYIYIYIYIYTHTHTHTHTSICMYVYNEQYIMHSDKKEVEILPFKQLGWTRDIWVRQRRTNMILFIHAIYIYIFITKIKQKQTHRHKDKAVVIRGKGAEWEVKWIKEMKCMVINGKQIFYGKHTVVYTETEMQCYAHGIYSFINQCYLKKIN